MKFRIIWIDDSQSWVNSVTDDLKEAFIDLHFQPEVEKYTSIDDESRQAIENNYLDLLIIDCNLPGLNGNEFIVELRAQRCFSHIIFYSQEAQNLQLVNADKHFLHATHRDDFHGIIEQVADQAYRKYNHPAFMRGLLLSEFIDLESLMDDFISDCFREQSEFFRESIINKGGESFGLGTKQKFISRILKEASAKDQATKEQITDIEFSPSQFQNKIIQKRNILAHAHPEYDSEDGIIKLISSFPDTIFDSNWFYQTRSDIHNFKNKIKQLIGLELNQVVNP